MNSITASTLAPRSTVRNSGAAVREVSVLRLNLLRVFYAVLAVGLGLYVWPDVLGHTAGFAHTFGIRVSLLAGIGAVAMLGLRYPLKMLPLLLFELAWKAIYLIAFALPLYATHQLDAVTTENVWACLMVVMFVPLVPWRHVWARFVTDRGERWL